MCPIAQPGRELHRLSQRERRLGVEVRDDVPVARNQRVIVGATVVHEQAVAPRAGRVPRVDQPGDRRPDGADEVEIARVQRVLPEGL